MDQSFSSLDIKWKILIVLGTIFTIISVVLVIVVAIMSETNLIPYKFNQTASDKDLEEFKDLFNNFGKEVNVNEDEVNKDEVNEDEVNKDEVNKDEVNEDEVNKDEVNKDEVNKDKVMDIDDLI